MAVKRIGISPDLLIHPGETISDIIDEVEKAGIVLCDKTLRKYRNEAIGILGEILWGYEDRESDSILEDIDSHSLS